MRALDRLPTTARLWAAGVLCMLPLGLVWSSSSGSFTIGYTLYGTCDYAEPGTYCTEDTYVPGTFTPGSSIHGFSSSARVFLVFAALVLVWTATRPRTTATRRWARLATVGAAVALVLALANRSVVPAVCLGLALGLAAPPAWRGTRPSPVFGNAPPDR